MDKDYLQKLFINEAKPALARHSGSGGGENTLKKLINYTKSIANMFRSNNAVTDLTGYLRYDDTSNATDAQNMFYNNANLERIPVFDMRKVVSTGYMFYGCSKLKAIPALDFRSVVSGALIFNNCIALEEVWIKNIKKDIQIGSGTTFGHLLTVESLIHLIKELRDKGDTMTFTVGSANLEKLANVYVKTVEITDEMRAEDDLIDEKLPFVVCESTDEGAMLITDYAQFKNWQVV